jgi:hypothetical protein
MENSFTNNLPFPPFPSPPAEIRQVNNASAPNLTPQRSVQATPSSSSNTHFLNSLNPSHLLHTVTDLIQRSVLPYLSQANSSDSDSLIEERIGLEADLPNNTARSSFSNSWIIVTLDNLLSPMYSRFNIWEDDLTQDSDADSASSSEALGVEREEYSHSDITQQQNPGSSSAQASTVSSLSFMNEEQASVNPQAQGESTVSWQGNAAASSYEEASLGDLEQLPIEIVERVLSYLEIQSLVQFERVNRRSLRIVNAYVMRCITLPITRETADWVNPRLVALLPAEDGVGVSLEEILRYRDTVLHYLLDQIEGRIVSLCKQCEINLPGRTFTAQDSQGNTALHLAVMLCDIQLSRLLLVHPSAAQIITIQYTEGWTVLHLSVYRADVELLRLILAHPSAGQLLIIKDLNGPYGFASSSNPR